MSPRIGDEVRTTSPYPSDNSGQVQRTERTTTPGSSFVDGSAPPVGGDTGTSGPSSAPTLAPPETTTDGSMGDLMLMLSKLQDKEMKSGLAGLTKNVQNAVDRKAKENLERAQQLIKSWKSMKKAKKEGAFAKKFGWVGKALAIVAAVATAILVPPPAGVALAGLMIAGMVINEVMQIPAVQKGLENALGTKGMMGLMIGIAVLQLVAAIAITVATGGAGGVAAAAEVEEIGAEAAEMGTEVAPEVASEATESAETTTAEGETLTETSMESETDSTDLTDGEGMTNDMEPKTTSTQSMTDDGTEGVSDYGEPDEEGSDEGLSKLRRGANQVRRGVTIAQAGTGMVQDGATMAAGFDKKDADMAQAAADKAIAEIARQAQFMKQDDELIKSLLQKLEAVFSTAAQVITTEHQGKTALAQGIQIPQTTA